mgnify:CR=1 FL=1|jgi:hypothetical protein
MTIHGPKELSQGLLFQIYGSEFAAQNGDGTDVPVGFKITRRSTGKFGIEHTCNFRPNLAQAAVHAMKFRSVSSEPWHERRQPIRI